MLGLWLAGEVTDARETFLLVDPARRMPVSMVAFGWLLYRLNALYERMRTAAADARRRARRGS